MTKGWYGNRQAHSLASKGIRTTNDIVRIKNEINTLPQPTRKIAMDYLINNVRADGKRIIVDWDKGYLTEREILLLKTRLNRGEEVDLSSIYNSDGFAITEEQTKKGYDWLMNQWKTPRGVERKNNPFGFREEDILDNFYRFEITGFHNIGNRYHDYYTPAYEVIAKDGRTFEYILKGGEISIIG